MDGWTVPFRALPIITIFFFSCEAAEADMVKVRIRATTENG